MKKNFTFGDLVKNNTIITGGHFMLTSDGSTINAGTVRSFREAAKLYSESRQMHKNIAFGVLINDIGAVCASSSSSSSCSIVPTKPKEEFSLPLEYVDVLDELKLSKEDVTIFWEKHMRNRGKKLLSKELTKQNKNITYIDGGYIFQIPEKRIQILLTRFSPHDQHGTPACPLIMSAYAIEHHRMGYDSSINFYYVSDDNYLNVANHYVIEKGKYFAKQVIAHVDIKNIYLFEDCTLSNFER